MREFDVIKSAARYFFFSSTHAESQNQPHKPEREREWEACLLHHKNIMSHGAATSFSLKKKEKNTSGEIFKRFCRLIVNFICIRMNEMYEWMRDTLTFLSRNFYYYANLWSNWNHFCLLCAGDFSFNFYWFLGIFTMIRWIYLS